MLRNKKLSLFLLILLSACASSPEAMRSKTPYYEANLNRPIVDAIDCVSKGIDAIDVGIGDPIGQSVKYLPNAKEGSIYLSSGKASNIAIVDFSGAKKANVKLLYNTNVIVVSNKLKQAVEGCKLP